MNLDTGDELFRRIVLEKLQVYAREGVSAYVLCNAQIERYTDIVTDSLVFALHSHVLAHEVGQESVNHIVTAHFDYEEWESFWQHTKAVHFPTLSRWMKRPPRKRTVFENRDHKVTVDIRSLNTFPAAEIVYPPELGRVELMVRKQIITSRDRPV